MWPCIAWIHIINDRQEVSFMHFEYVLLLLQFIQVVVHCGELGIDLKLIVLLGVSLQTLHYVSTHPECEVSISMSIIISEQDWYMNDPVPIAIRVEL